MANTLFICLIKLVLFNFLRFLTCFFYIEVYFILKKNIYVFFFIYFLFFHSFFLVLDFSLLFQIFSYFHVYIFWNYNILFSRFNNFQFFLFCSNIAILFYPKHFLSCPPVCSSYLPLILLFLFFLSTSLNFLFLEVHTYFHLCRYLYFLLLFLLFN